MGMGQSTLRAAQMGGSLLLAALFMAAEVPVALELLLPSTVPRTAERGVGISKGLVEVIAEETCPFLVFAFSSGSGLVSQSLQVLISLFLFDFLEKIRSLDPKKISLQIFLIHCLDCQMRLSDESSSEMWDDELMNRLIQEVLKETNYSNDLLQSFFFLTAWAFSASDQ